MSKLCFEDSDFYDGLPPPGGYPSKILSARLRRSSRGNNMIEVVLLLETDAGSAQVSDYFVLDGVGSRGLAVARHRLVELYRTCGLDPQGGDEIQPEVLVGRVVEVKIRHEERENGDVRLQVVGYRPIPRLTDDLPF